MAYKTDKLKARIVEKYGDQKSFAEALGITESSLSRILNEGRDWKGSVLMKAIELLDVQRCPQQTHGEKPQAPGLHRRLLV